MPPHQDPPLFDSVQVMVVDNDYDDDMMSTMTPDMVAESSRLRCAVLGCGMMGQEHCSYIMGYSDRLQIDFLCDPHQPSLDKCFEVLREFANPSSSMSPLSPTLVYSEEELLKYANEIDLLVICTPNYLHTDTILRWGKYEHLTILVEKPVAVSRAQHNMLQAVAPDLKARIWVAMEYRFMPAVAKLVSLLREGTVGDIKMVTIRENRFPFLHKVGRWNRDRNKTGDSLVEKCCHFFDLMRLITQREANLPRMRTMAQRGLNYHDETPVTVDGEYVPIIDAAYVTLPFQSPDKVKAMGCLELCMYADGSRHQEEIIVTGTKGRLEAYMPENKVYSYQRPADDKWTNRSEPPPAGSIVTRVYDCDDVCAIHGIESKDSNSSPIPTHGGYHYSSTAVEWYRLLEGIDRYQETGDWKPLVSLEDGLRAVEMGLQATESIVNEAEE